MDFPGGFIFGMYHVWYCAVTPEPAGGAADRRLVERLHPVVVEWLPHPNRGVTPIKQAKHYFSQFHPTYVGAEKAAALAKEAGFENWVQHFSDLNNSWSELPKFNTERPMLTAYRLAEIGTDLARWERNPYYWKIDVEGNQLPYLDGINVELLQDLQVFAGKIIAGEMTISIGWYAPLSDYPLLKQNEEAGDYTVELWPSLEGSAGLFQVNRTVDDPVLAPIFSDSRFSHGPVAGAGPRRDQRGGVPGSGDPATAYADQCVDLLRAAFRRGIRRARPGARQSDPR